MLEKPVFRGFCAYLKCVLFACVSCMMFVFGGISFAHADETYPFSLTTTTLSDQKFQFTMSAEGTFYVDCGTDGTLSGNGVTENSNVINRAGNTTSNLYTCTYQDTESKTIRFGGKATSYNADVQSNNLPVTVAAISFYNSKEKVQSIAGNLSTIFPWYSSAHGRSPMFYRTFKGCTNITSIPENLFADLAGCGGFMFDETFMDCTGLTSIPSGQHKLFSFDGANGPVELSSQYVFASTFEGCTNLTSIPSDLFSRIKNENGLGTYAFGRTFGGCTALTTIPETLFSTITKPSTSMFSMTFQGCENITEIPVNLFNFGNVSNDTNKYVDGVGALFYHTFFGCKALTKIPSGLFSYVKSGAQNMFEATFGNCTGLQTTVVNGQTIKPIPDDLFNFADNNVDGAKGLFNGTFSGCSNLTSIPNTLFSHVKSGAEFMFYGTFRDCDNLQEIPASLFNFADNNVDGAKSLFNSTFSGCSDLTSIPNTLFSHVKSGAEQMFAETFMGCTGLKYLPENLFASIKTPAEKMFYRTFKGCDGFVEDSDAAAPSAMYNFIPKNLFSVASDGNSGLINESYPTQSLNATDMMTDIFDSSSLSTQCPVDYYRYTTGYESDWDEHVSCAPCPPDTHSPAGSISIDQCVEESIDYPFSVTTTTLSDKRFQFTMSAVGTFYVDCGTGGTLTSDASPSDISGNSEGGFIIDRSNVGASSENWGNVYTCSYSDTNSKTIQFGGQATGYIGYPAISFNTSVTMIGGDPADTNVKKISSISGSLGQIFGTIENPPTNLSGQPNFYMTFYGATNMTGTNIDDPNTGMKYALPPTLFAGISGAPAERMFAHTFSNCSNLTGSIPSTLFAGISGAPAESMFLATFSGCNNLTGPIPEGLFGNLDGDPAIEMFMQTFHGCTRLTGSIPEGLFAGISGLPAERMFMGTFNNCINLTETNIPDEDNPGMYYAIPPTLFGGIEGGPAEYMFSNTFGGCSKLNGTIPSGLFAGIYGEPAESMFERTFAVCKKLIGSIPADLFDGTFGTPAKNMFSGTFDNCSNLTGFGDTTYVPWDFLGDIEDNDEIQNQATDMFTGTQLENPCPADTYSVTRSQFGDAGKPWCNPCPPGKTSSAGATDISQCVEPVVEHEYSFTLTTTELSENNKFQFSIFAGGTFYVDCGTDGTLSGKGVSGDTITKTSPADFSTNLYTCTYTSGGAKTIRFGGKATDYNTFYNTTSIEFTSSAKKISSISGSLGQIFGTIIEPSEVVMQPNFYMTFYGATNMTGTNIPDEDNPDMYYALPPTLFDGIYGAPVFSMFRYTFYGCSGLTGSIPSTLFGNLTGSPATSMFSSTFEGCSGLTGSIPVELFAGISGTPADDMFHSTFKGCSGLTGSIPSGLFAGISGEPAEYMFSGTFHDCSGLTGLGDTTYVPETFLANINTNVYVYAQAMDMFAGTQLDDSCPTDMYENTRVQFSNAGKPWCSPCPPGTHSPAGSTSIDQCLHEYTLTYDCNDANSNTFDGGITDSVNALNATEVLEYCEPGTGQILDTWLCGEENIAPGAPITLAANTTCTAQWICDTDNGYYPKNGVCVNDYGITYTSSIPAGVTVNGMPDPLTEEVPAGTENYELAPLPTATGYNITGWDCGSNVTVSANNTITMPSTGITCSLVWGCDTSNGYRLVNGVCNNEYSITYSDDLPDGVTVNGMPDPLTVEVPAGTEEYELADLPTATGYNITGWDCGNNVTVSSNNTITMPSTGITCSLVWGCDTTNGYRLVGGVCNNTYVVEYSCGESSGVAPTTNTYAVYGEQFTSANNTCDVPNGAVFAGWGVGGTDDIVSGSFTWNYTEDKIFTAVWGCDTGHGYQWNATHDACVFVCDTGKWLHIGNEKMCLYTNKPSSPALAIKIGEEIYYLRMESGDEGLKINDHSNKKFKIEREGILYNVSDISTL